MARTAGYRWLGAVATAVGLLAAATAAPPDATELAKAKQQIAEQKAERDLADAFAAADQQARFSRAKAADILKSAKQNLQFASIGEAARTRLTNAVDAKLAALEGRPAPNPAVGNPVPKPDPKSPEVIAAQKAAEEKATAEFKDVVNGLKKVQAAQDKNDTAEANREIARLTKSYPNNPSVIALTQDASIKARLDDAIAFQALQRERWVAHQKNLMMSSLPAIYDVEFPSDWKEKSERRLKATQIQMSAKDKRIIEALDKPVNVNFKERPFEEALQDLSNLIDQPLLLDKRSVEDLSLDLKRGVSHQSGNLSARTVLRSVLAGQGLTFVVKDEAIQIVTVERARSILTTRVYYIGDLINGTGPFGGIQWGPNLNAQQAAANADAVVQMIRKSIDPLSWNGETGGPGSITFHYPSMSVIVRASAEVHYTLGRSLK
ncbi:MAG: hypothetical protein ACKODX_19395 [Gemmata sp.]